MANRAGTGRNSSKKNIKNSVILNSEETMRKMDIFGDTLFGKEKEEEKVTETINVEPAENENVTEKVEENVPIQEEKIDDLDFEIAEISEPQSTLTDETTYSEDIAQNFEQKTVAEEVAPIVDNIVAEEKTESVENPSIEEVAMDDILSMIDEENEEEIKIEEPIGTTDFDSTITQNLEENIAVSEPIEENISNNSNLSDFSSEILSNASSIEETAPNTDVSTETASIEAANENGGMKIEDLLIGNTLLEMMQNADIDVNAIERTEGREALKMIGEE